MKNFKNNFIMQGILSLFFILIFFLGCRIKHDEPKDFAEVSIDSEEWLKILDLKGDWKFSIGDDERWSQFAFDDKNWESIHVPSSWENEGFHGYDGYAWYRKSFYTPGNSDDHNLYLHLGFIDDVDEVYLNEKLIGSSGSFPPFYRTAYSAFRRYYIPPDIIRTDKENVIAVRVYDSQLMGGIVSGDVGIYRSRKSPDLDIVLEGEWKFALGDDFTWKNPDFKDTAWTKIIVPGFWENQGFENYDGFAWYRKSFSVSENLVSQKLVLILGKVDDFDEVFINGTSIGSTGDINKNPWNASLGEHYQQSRFYNIPSGLLNSGNRNIIAVRVFDGYIDGGIYQGPVGIILQENFTKFWRKKN